MPYNTFAAQLNTRLRRMTQVGSPQWKAIKYALCLPLVMSLVLFFSVNYLQALPLPNGEITLGESIEEIAKAPVLPVTVSAAPQKTVRGQFKLEKIPTLKLDTVPVPVQSTIKITSTSGTGVNISSNTETYTIGQNGMVSNGPGKPLIIIDGKNMSKTDGDPMSKLDPGKIQTISVLKGESATKIYGDDGKDGVIIVETKGYKGGEVKEIKLNNVNINTNVETGTKLSEPMEIRITNINGISGDVDKANIDASLSSKEKLKFKGVDGYPLIVKDGKVLGRLHQHQSDDPLKDIDINTIKNINVYKGQKGIDKYGKDAEDGVIEIETKKQ